MRGLINKKKGAAHFEMIISFVFFVGFVLFLFMVLKPQDTSILSGAVISGLYDSFEEKVHTNLSNMFLKANYTGSDCFHVELPGHVFNYAIVNQGSFVTNISGDKVFSDLDGSKLSINKDEIFLKIAISPEFDGDLISCSETLNDFDLGSIIERRVISHDALKKMKSKYSNDYETLRKELGVPPIFDFAIVAENLSINMEPQFGIPDAVEVMAQDRIAEVLDRDGTVINERFTLKIW